MTPLHPLQEACNFHVQSRQEYPDNPIDWLYLNQSICQFFASIYKAGIFDFTPEEYRAELTPRIIQLARDKAITMSAAALLKNALANVSDN